MPRISADSVAEHVAQQEAALFDAALRLFAERGYARVSLADIAAEMGLKRTSLYRYVPDKAHLVLLWLRRELPVQAARSRELLGGDGPPAQRLDRWAMHQLDYAETPEHRVLSDARSIAADLDPDARAELADSHRALMEPLDDLLREAGLEDGADRAAAASLIGSLVLGAADHEARHGRDEAVRRRLLAALASLAAPGGRR